MTQRNCSNCADLEVRAEADDNAFRQWLETRRQYLRERVGSDHYMTVGELGEAEEAWHAALRWQRGE